MSYFPDGKEHREPPLLGLPSYYPVWSVRKAGVEEENPDGGMCGRHMRRGVYLKASPIVSGELCSEGRLSVSLIWICQNAR